MKRYKRVSSINARKPPQVSLSSCDSSCRSMLVIPSAGEGPHLSSWSSKLACAIIIHSWDPSPSSRIGMTRERN